MLARVAVVSARPDYWDKLSEAVLQCDAHPIRCETLAAVTQLLSQKHVDLAICEDALPDGTFREFVAAVKRSGSCVPIVVVSIQDDWGSFLNAMVAGAFDYVGFPPFPGELERALSAALAEWRSNRAALARHAA